MRPTLSAPLVGALVICALLLASCDTVKDLSAEHLRTSFGVTEESVLSRGWLETRTHPVTPVYCYRTIGSPDCYRHPQRGEQRRLIGYYDPVGY